jgi:putative transposase
MRGPKPPSVELTDLERNELQRLLKRHLTPQRMVLRARIVLAAADGANNGQIARRLGVSLDMVRRWRERWIALEEASLNEEEGLAVEERLTDAPRPGKPRTITPEQECQIIALACESPQEGSAQRPISQWTGREIAEEIERRGICETISARHAGRLLGKRGISKRI